MTTRRSPTPVPTVRVVGYVRLSRAKDESTSVSRQRDLIAALCAARGWELVEIVEDLDVSATKRRLNRPGLDRVRHLAATGQCDAVVFWRLDRLARSVQDAANLAAEFKAAAVALVSCTEPFDTSSPAGQLMYDLLAAFAAFEAGVISERVLGSRAALVADHRHAGSRPFGYATAPNPNGPGRVLVPDPIEAAVVRRAASMVLDDGASLSAVVRTLNAQGAPTRGGTAQWGVTALRNVLTGDAVLGRITHHGEPLRDDQGHPIEVWEPVLSLSEVQRLRARLSGRGPRTRRATRLLSGLLRCSQCEADVPLHVSSNSTGTFRYGCVGKQPGRHHCDRPISVTAERVEEEVARQFLALLGDHDRVRVSVSEVEPERLIQVEEAIQFVGAALVAAVGSDDEEAVVLTKRLAELKAERDALRAAPAETTIVYESTGQTWGQAWDEAADAPDPIATRRGLLAAVIEHVVIQPGVRGRKGLEPERVQIQWRDLVEQVVQRSAA